MGEPDPAFDLMMREYNHEGEEAEDREGEEEQPINEGIVQQIENLGLDMVNRDMIIQVCRCVCVWGCVCYEWSIMQAQ